MPLLNTTYDVFLDTPIQHGHAEVDDISANFISLDMEYDTASSELRVFPGKTGHTLAVNGAVTATEVFLGPPNQDGTWKISQSGNDLAFSLRVGGEYVIKSSITP